MREQIMPVVYAMLDVFAVFCVGFTVRWHWRKWRWGCSRCAYRKTIKTLNGPWTGCTASCGNNEGRTCPAWFYQDPGEDENA